MASAKKKSTKKAPAKKAAKKVSADASETKPRRGRPPGSTKKKAAAKKAAVSKIKKSAEKAEKPAVAQEQQEEPKIFDSVNAPEIQSKIRELIRIAKEQDYITFDDLNETLPQGLVTPDVLDEIMERLRGMEFKIIDAAEVDDAKPASDKDDDDDSPSSKADSKLDILDDPVRMYLKQMGQVPLLTREEEVEISKRIEKAEVNVVKHLHRLAFTGDAYLKLAQSLLDGRERFDRIIIDKQVASRESFLKRLPKLCEQVREAGGLSGA